MKNNYNQKNNKNIQKQKYENKEEKTYEDQVEGRNSVLELLESGKDVNKIFVTRGEKHGSINKILGIAKERKIIILTQGLDRSVESYLIKKISTLYKILQYFNLTF